MITVTEHPNGGWFAHCDDRVLGPFKSEWAAWRAARQHEKELEERKAE